MMTKGEDMNGRLKQFDRQGGGLPVGFGVASSKQKGGNGRFAAGSGAGGGSSSSTRSSSSSSMTAIPDIRGARSSFPKSKKSPTSKKLVVGGKDDGYEEYVVLSNLQ